MKGKTNQSPCIRESVIFLPWAFCDLQKSHTTQFEIVFYISWLTYEIEYSNIEIEYEPINRVHTINF